MVLRHDIESHSSWLLEYYGSRGNVPPHYQKYLREIESVSSDVVIGQIELIVEENDQLKKENEKLKKGLDETVAGIEMADAMIHVIARLVMRRFGN